jgi:hypothetical protein
MSACVYSVSVLFCDGLITSPRNPAACVKDTKTAKASKVQQSALEPKI